MRSCVSRRHTCITIRTRFRYVSTHAREHVQVEEWYPHVSKPAVMDALTASLADLAAANGVGISPEGALEDRTAQCVFFCCCYWVPCLFPHLFAHLVPFLRLFPKPIYYYCIEHTAPSFTHITS